MRGFLFAQDLHKLTWLILSQLGKIPDSFIHPAFLHESHPYFYGVKTGIFRSRKRHFSCLNFHFQTPSMEVVCLEDKAFYALIEKVVARLKQEHGVEHDKWIADTEAMRLLKIKSKTTLQNLRDDGKIRFTQPQKKIILYDRDSINEYLEKNARNTF